MKSNLLTSVDPLPKTNCISQLWALSKWSLIRHKVLLPVFTMAQILLSLAIVYGLALLIPDINTENATYLSSGATTLGIIAVGCVLAAQIISSAKQDGIVQYQKSLPVSRINILLADFIIWGLASLPGVFMSFLAASLRFGITINFSVQGLLILLLSQLSMISIGFCIAYWLPANGVAMATQLIMIGGLLFSPITYPAERLPEWLILFHNMIPFVPASSLIRASFYTLGTVQMKDILVVLLWTLLTSGLSLLALSKRD